LKAGCGSAYITLLLLLLLQYGASCGDLKDGCQSDPACAQQGSIGSLMAYLPNFTPYYRQQLGELRQLLDTAAS
jgi:hypothetical protein